MEQFIKDRFNDAILHQAAQGYGVEPAVVKVLDSFESFIFEFPRDGKEYILRIGHSHRRNQTLIEGETEWINYLVAGGVSAAQAIHSINDKLVESIPDGHGGDFLAVAFAKAPGGPARGRWTAELYQTYGETIGRMHKLTQAYTTPPKRPQWDAPIFDFVNTFLPDSEHEIKQRYKQVCDYVRTLPKDAQSYGLTHQDAHSGNLFIDDDGRITLFDFDDCGYNWLVNDIAMVLFYMASTAEDKAAFTAEFMPPFLRGYASQCTLEPVWLREMPHFMKIRELELYAVIHRDFDVERIDNPWIANFMRGRRERIDAGQPYIEFDFATLEPLLSS